MLQVDLCHQGKPILELEVVGMGQASISLSYRWRTSVLQSLATSSVLRLATPTLCFRLGLRNSFFTARFILTLGVALSARFIKQLREVEVP